MKNKVIVILGPTSSGKSDLAVLLAKKFDGEVISADSRQVYKGLDIGTGKITKKEMKGVKHHLLDVTTPKKVFSASDFVKLARAAIEDIASRGKVPIICGGTGFYISALLGEVQMSEVPPNPKLRNKLEKETTENLFKMLLKLDPERAKNIDAKNPHRLIRAIEIAVFSSKKPSVNLKSSIFNLESDRYEVLKIGVMPISESHTLDEERLKKRIQVRLIKRIKRGMIAEAKKLHAQGVSFKRMRELGLEYGALADHLQGKITKREMIERLKTEIWHFVKRQMTWWKRDKEIIWFNSSDVESMEPCATFAFGKVREFLRK